MIVSGLQLFALLLKKMYICNQENLRKVRNPAFENLRKVRNPLFGNLRKVRKIDL